MLDEVCSCEHLLEMSSWECDWKSIIESEQDTTESVHEQGTTEQQKREKVLLKWKEQQGSGATYWNLIETLRKIENKDVASRVRCLATTGM